MSDEHEPTPAPPPLPEAEVEVESAEEAEARIDRLLEAGTAPPSIVGLAPSGATESLVGEVVDVRHPTLRGRIRVRYQSLDGLTFEKWLPTLMNLPVRVSDRVLMVRASNWPEFVVNGVLDGFSRRPEAPRQTGAALELQQDEAIRVQTPGGEDLVEIFQDERGPVVRLLKEDVDLDIPGKLRLRAKSIELEAKEGAAKVTATDDVIIRGEVVHLN